MARWDKDDQSGNGSIPDWFWQAVETEADTRSVEVDECDVVYRHYPNTPHADGTAKQGMLLVHGMNAHSRWWDFIAPQLLDLYDVAAMDLTGMGDSDYRYSYDSATFAQEIKAVLDDVGFGNDALVVAHSFGGYMAVRAANDFPDRFAGLILIDSGIRHPDDPPPDRPLMGGGRGKAYPDKATALNRFRLQPPQPCANQYILEYIARNSLMSVDGGGWAWKFDEDLLTTLKDGERQPEEYANLRTKVGLIYGAQSELFSRRTLDYMRELIPQDFPAVELADAQHHLFLDQPLAFVDSLRTMCADLLK